MANPTALVLRPDYAASPSGPLTPTLSGSARVVETAVPAPGYATDLPDSRNYFPNPYADISVASWAAWGAGATLSVGTDAPGWNGVGAKLVHDGAASAKGLSANSGPLNTPGGTPWSGQFELIGSGTYNVWMRVSYTDASPANETAMVPYVLSGAPTLVKVENLVPNAAKTVAEITLFARSATAFSGTIWAKNAQIENRATCSPFIDPRNDPNAWFVGTENASQSVRKAIIPKATNLITNPLGIDGGAAWTAQGTTVVDHEEVAPDGSVATKLTWGTGTPNTSQVVRTPKPGLVVGAPYIATCEVYVPSGNPGVRVSVHSVGYQPVTTINDEWVKIAYPFIATSTSATFNVLGFNADVVATAGQHCFVRNCQMEVGIEATPFVNPNNDPLASFDGTVNNSTSTRLRTPSLPAWEVLEATTNANLDPYGMGALTNYGTSAQNTLSKVPVFGIDKEFPAGASWVAATLDSGSTWMLDFPSFTNRVAALTGQTWTISGWLYQSTGSPVTVTLDLREYTSGGTYIPGTGTTTIVVPSGEPTPFTYTRLLAGGGTVAGLVARLQAALTVGQRIMLFGGQLEQKAYPTPLCPQLDPATGNPLTGYAWTGTAHGSASTRTAGRVHVPMPHGVPTDTGSAVVMYRRYGAINWANGTPRVWEIGGYGQVNDFIGVVMTTAGASRLTATSGASEAMSPTTGPGGHVANVDYIGYAEWTPTTGRYVDQLGEQSYTRNTLPTGVPNGSLDLGGSDGGSNSCNNGLIYSAAFFKRPLTEHERYQLENYESNDGFRVDTFDKWELLDMAIRRTLRGSVGVAGLAGTGLTSGEKSAVLARLTALEGEKLGDHNDTVFATPYASGSVVTWDGTKFVLSTPAAGMSAVKRGGTSVVAPAANLDFTTAFLVSNGGSGEADVAPNFGTAAGTIAEGNHAHNQAIVDVFSTASGSLSNITSGSPTVVSGSIGPLAAGAVYKILAIAAIEQYGNSGTTGIGRVRVTINGNSRNSASSLTAEQGVDSPKLGGHAFTVTGTGANITISAAVVWESGTIRPQEAVLFVIAVPDR